jgi:SAM-dependent methyltransferase
MNGMPQLDPLYDRFQLIANGPALFNAVVTGLELDIFGFLSGHPGASFDDLHDAVGIAPHHLRVLMLGLCATGLVTRQDSRYANSAFADANLAPHGDSWRDILIGWQRIYYPAFAHTTAAMRECSNMTALTAHPGTEPTLYQRLAHDPVAEAVLHRSMASFTQLTMPGLVEAADLSGVRRLLDIGGGDGTSARNLVAVHPDLRVTIFDMPSVIGLARDAIPASVANRVGMRQGDLFADPFPGGADAVLFSHVLEVFSPDRIQQVLAKAVDVLPSGGKVFIYGFNAPDDEAGGVLAARLSLYLTVLASGQGMAYPARDYEDWLRRVGCVGVKTVSCLPYEHGLTVGIKA